ncbi:MAG: sigma-70 family RNA polymerase sigma factor [Anaerolineaceae bacterium]
MLAKQLTMNLSQTTRRTQSKSAELACDLELVRRIVAKEECALHELYTMYGQRLYSYALCLTADPALAEDVVQDTLEAVWHSAKSYRGEGRLIAWLMKIIHHTVSKSLRHRPMPISEEMESNLYADEPLPEDQTQSNEQTALIRQGLKKLSPEHRMVLELVFYQGLSLKEIADVCNCPVGTIKSRLSYARQQLRGVLSRMEEI